MSRATAERAAINEDLADLDRLDELEDPWSWGVDLDVERIAMPDVDDTYPPHIDYPTSTQED